MAKATIVAASKKFTVKEGNYAVSTFKFVQNDGTTNQALDNEATVQVRLTGIGATKTSATATTAKDYSGFYYRTGNGNAPAVKADDNVTNSNNPAANEIATTNQNGTTVPAGWTAVPADGKVKLNKGDTWIQLTSMVNKDTVGAEQNESLVFSLAQTNIGSTAKTLENSYYVTSTANIKESITVLSKITVDKADAVEEGKNAEAIFKLSSALQGGPAKVAVKVEGQGATLGEDTTGALIAATSIDGSTWAAATIKNGQIEVPASTTKIKLSVATVKDNVTETNNEQLNFSVRQISGNLKDSYYVNAVVDLMDPAVKDTGSDVVATSSQDTLKGSNGQDLFDMTKANSKPFFDSFDTIGTGSIGDDTRFGTGDVIRLNDSVQRYSIGEVDFQEFTGKSAIGSAITVANYLIDTLSEQKYDDNFPNGTGSILKIVLTDEVVYLLIDTNANGKMDTRLDTDDGGDGLAGGLDNQYDTLIKVVGSVIDGYTLSEQLTGERFITE